MRSILMTVLCIALSLAINTATAADVSEATFTAQGRTKYAAVLASDVEVYVFRPEFKFRVIGLIEARGMADGTVSILDQLNIFGQLLGDRPAQPGEKEDIALAIRALKTEAAENGALGVIIVRSIQVPVGQGATERRIVAAAIRPE